jgi:FAD/FMN-containing dehydrogenase
MDRIFEALADIVGREYVSNRSEELFIYSRDMGTMDPHNPDYVVLPSNSSEVQKVIYLANQEKIPVVPMGGGLVLSALTVPLKGGIVLDMKRMDQILEVSEQNRYAIVEAGTPQGKLQAHLQKNYPRLKHSIPDAPPMATIAGNILIHGSGHLSQATGFHSEMLTGLEVVLPTGEICKIGSCSTSPYWFSRAPLPDLAGLFVGWFGTTGVVTKLAIKLYPRPSQKDVAVFVTEDPGFLPDILLKIADTEMAEDLNVTASAYPAWLKDLQLTLISITANSDAEMDFKRRTIKDTLRSYSEDRTGGFIDLPLMMKGALVETPMRTAARFADARKGGGFEYVGAIMPVGLFPQACRAGMEIAARHGLPYTMMIRVIGRCHSMMFAFGYPFNRSDPKDIENAKQALHESNAAALEMGGIPWKAEEPAQQLIMKQMDPTTIALMNRVRSLLDPNGIMNPGNWEEH